MKIDISSLEQEPLQFDERLAVEPERLDSEVVTTPVAVRLEGEVRADGEAVTVSGRFRAEGTVACSRCLDDVQWTVDEPFSVEYRWPDTTAGDDEIGLEEEDLDVSFLEENELDLRNWRRSRFCSLCRCEFCVTKNVPGCVRPAAPTATGPPHVSAHRRSIRGGRLWRI